MIVLRHIRWGVVLLVAEIAAAAGAAEPKFAMLIAQRPGEPLTVEADTAREVAQRLVSAVPLWPAEDGKFVDRSGKETPLTQFAAVWCHQGDLAAAAGPIEEPGNVAALRRYAEQGGGLLLSGVAAGLLPQLDLATLQTQPVTFGQDRAQAGLIPLAAAHPAFRGLDLDRGVAWMSNAAFPAFGRFHPGEKPSQGMVLAHTPGGAENPLVEYPLGHGRVVASAWRLSPHYHIAPAGLRANFERLTANLLVYLSDPQSNQATIAESGKPSIDPVPAAQWQALDLALQDLCSRFADRYPHGPEYRQRLAELKKSYDALTCANASPGGTSLSGAKGVAEPKDPQPRPSLRSGTCHPADSLAADFRRLQSEALLANPLLDFDRLLLIKRGEKKLGLPTNYQSNSSLDPAGYDNEIAVLSPVRPDGKLDTLYRPTGGRFVGDVDLHFDADRLLFSMPAEASRWNVWELKTDGTGLRRLPLGDEPDVDRYDACYLPDDRVVFTSTAPMAGVPCVRGSAHVANLFLLGTDNSIRQLTVEQDHDWCPTVLPSGRVLYLRWEYTDIPHAFSRILFSMNPDGTGQAEHYGSNSYWPASMFYARPVPGHSTKFVAVVGGHHEMPRMGDLVLFDPAQGRFEAEGAVQRIPGRGRKVDPVILDLPIGQTWPKFLHPWPLDEKYFLVSCKPSADAPWGIYLADVFDNLVLVRQQSPYAMLEPVPLRKTPRPPVLPDKIDLARRDAEIFLADIYAGPGLQGVPRGTVKSLRVTSYQFAYQGMGGEPDAPGMDGPWDVKRILGTVPVCDDGSAHFRVPACTPIALQPLDAEGKAVQLMRSWFTAMPGEVLSCVGCHEKQNSTPLVRGSLASAGPAEEIRPWHGPARGFDFRREVQPVLDQHCLACHDGREQSTGAGFVAPDLTDRPPVPTMPNKNSYNLASRFTPSYFALRKLVRTPTRESDMHLLAPWEYHADTSRLVQMLQRGHHGAELDAESWDRLVTWIDLNAPAHGTWTEICGEKRVAAQSKRRQELRKQYTQMDDDPETILTAYQPPPTKSVARPAEPAGPSTDSPRVSGWPLDAAEAKRQQEAAGDASLSIPLGEGISLELARIPAGRFVMGQADGSADQRPCSVVSIGRPFWMGRFEVTNRQFALFDPAHDSGLEYGDYIQFSPGERGWTLSRAQQPVVRVSWRRAAEFCRWLSEKTGKKFNLPTEAQWEYACRAGAATPYSYGAPQTDFSRFANHSDITHQTIDPFGWTGRGEVIPPWRPADTRFNDHSRVSAPVGTYQPNAWGLYDMHGNVAEWTRSTYRPYPYADDGCNSLESGIKKVVRGGSWYDPPARATAAFRQPYAADQGVYDVGFRVICENP